MNNTTSNREFINRMFSCSQSDYTPTQEEFKKLAELASDYFEKQRKEHNLNKTQRVQIKLLCKTLEEAAAGTAAEKSMNTWFEVSREAAKRFRTGTDEPYVLD